MVPPSSGISKLYFSRLASTACKMSLFDSNLNLMVDLSTTIYKLEDEVIICSLYDYENNAIKVNNPGVYYQMISRHVKL